MFNYIYNIGADIIYGYIKVKCANKTCGRVFYFSRNNFIKTEYCCNMGCSLEAYNQNNN